MAPTDFKFSGLLASRENGVVIVGAYVNANAGWTGYHEILPYAPLVRVDDLSGEQQILDVWDGASAIYPDWEPGNFMPVPDQNGDGIEDYWVNQLLIPGPLYGRVVDPSMAFAEVHADDYGIVAVDFDADGDGIDDILTMPGYDHAVIRYGPFSGLLPSSFKGEAAPETYTQLGDGTNLLAPAATILPDHYQGKDGVVIGRSGQAADALAFVLEQPRGARIPASEARAVVRTGAVEHVPHFSDIGDVDGDGQPDLIYGTWSTASVGQGPLTGEFELADNSDDLPVALQTVDVFEDPLFGVGDLNGDGIDEFTVRVVEWDSNQPETTAVAWWVIAVSPHSNPLDLSCAFPMGPVGSAADDKTPLGARAKDLDGDGLPDLISQSHNSTRINIWWGKDLAKAITKHSAPKTPTQENP